MSEHRSVLIVDDEHDIRELLVLTLGRMGLRTETAPTLSAARELLAAGAYDLCLTDMRLPDGNGIELVTEIARQYPQTPVAMISTSTSPGFGPSSRTVSMVRGCPAAQATAARVSICQALPLRSLRWTAHRGPYHRTGTRSSRSDKDRDIPRQITPSPAPGGGGSGSRAPPLRQTDTP